MEYTAYHIGAVQAIGTPPQPDMKYIYHAMVIAGMPIYHM